MKTKQFIRLTLICIFSFSFNTISANDKEIETTKTTIENKKEDSKAAQVLISRLYEIQDLTKKNLSPSERRELKKEVKEIRNELKQIQNGLFISFGLIIIILLLIIIL